MDAPVNGSLRESAVSLPRHLICSPWSSPTSPRVSPPHPSTCAPLSRALLAGRQCMASCFFVLRQFDDVLIYLSSIEAYFPNDLTFQYNYAIAKAAAGKYAEAEPALLALQARPLSLHRPPSLHLPPPLLPPLHPFPLVAPHTLLRQPCPPLIRPLSSSHVGLIGGTTIA
eukprot:6196092-Pleurochrysis_carterae.AAC.1